MGNAEEEMSVRENFAPVYRYSKYRFTGAVSKYRQVALADAQMEVLTPAMQRSENMSAATTSGFANFSAAWEAGAGL